MQNWNCSEINLLRSLSAPAVPDILILHNEQGASTEAIVDIDSVFKFDAVVIMVEWFQMNMSGEVTHFSPVSPVYPLPQPPPSQPPVSSSHKNSGGQTTLWQSYWVYWLQVSGKRAILRRNSETRRQRTQRTPLHPLLLILLVDIQL